MSMIRKIKIVIYGFYRNIKNSFIRISREQLWRLDYISKSFPRVLTTSETLRTILENKSSICRFGDAEFDIMNQENFADVYQKPSDELSTRLLSILRTSSSSKLIICIPPFNSKYNNLKKYHGKLSFWEWYWLTKFEKIHPNLVCDYYGNSFISRDAVFYENSIDDIKSIWRDRNVVFVYSENGRFNHDSALFDNIKHKEFLHVKPTNAFEDYNNLLKDSLNFSKDNLFLIAAGPTATVLAYDLSILGYQALDVGHLPNCYDQYRGIIDSPESMPLVRK